MSDEKDGAGFEDAIARLESVVEQLDAGSLTLEESLAAFEQGVAMQRRCMEILNAAQQRIETLTEEANGAAAAGFSVRPGPTADLRVELDGDDAAASDPGR